MSGLQRSDHRDLLSERTAQAIDLSLSTCIPPWVLTYRIEPGVDVDVLFCPVLFRLYHAYRFAPLARALSYRLSF